jgi:hypothetical protein
MIRNVSRWRRLLGELANHRANVVGVVHIVVSGSDWYNLRGSVGFSFCLAAQCSNEGSRDIATSTSDCASTRDTPRHRPVSRAAKALKRPFPREQRSRPISPRANSRRNDDPAGIEPSFFHGRASRSQSVHPSSHAVRPLARRRAIHCRGVPGWFLPSRRSRESSPAFLSASFIRSP